MGIEYKGNQGAKGRKSCPTRMTAEEMSKTSHVSSHKLRLRLIDDKVKEHKCEICNNFE